MTLLRWSSPVLWLIHFGWPGVVVLGALGVTALPHVHGAMCFKNALWWKAAAQKGAIDVGGANEKVANLPWCKTRVD